MSAIESNRRAVQVATGAPQDAVSLRQEAIPEPLPGEVVVELVTAPINPAELLMLEGRYGWGETVPTLPRDMGIEGVGRVVGGKSSVLPIGTLVSLAGAGPVFSDFRTAPAERLVRVPDGIDADTFALTFINAQAVLVMLAEWEGEVRAGDWIIQNAANSAYGRVLTAAAASRGINVVNIVRSDRAAGELIESAASPVLVDGDNLEAQVLAATGGMRPKVAVDAVGGSATGRLAKSLAAGGRLAVYGRMSDEPIWIDTSAVLFGGVRVEGFWMPRSMARIGAERLRRIAAEAAALVGSSGVRIPIAARYGLDDIVPALGHARQGERGGKVVVTR